MIRHAKKIAAVTVTTVALAALSTPNVAKANWSDALGFSDYRASAPAWSYWKNPCELVDVKVGTFDGLRNNLSVTDLTIDYGYQRIVVDPETGYVQLEPVQPLSPQQVKVYMQGVTQWQFNYSSGQAVDENHALYHDLSAQRKKLIASHNELNANHDELESCVKERKATVSDLLESSGNLKASKEMDIESLGMLSEFLRSIRDHKKLEDRYKELLARYEELEASYENLPSSDHGSRAEILTKLVAASRRLETTKKRLETSMESLETSNQKFMARHEEMLARSEQLVASQKKILLAAQQGEQTPKGRGEG